MANDVPSLFRSLPASFSAEATISAPVTACPVNGISEAPPASTTPMPVHECDLSYIRAVLTRKGMPARTLLIPNASDQAGGESRVDVLSKPRRDLAGSRPQDTSHLELSVVAYASCSGRTHPMLTIVPAGGHGVECESAAGVLAGHSTPLYRPLRSWEDALFSGETFQIWNLLQWFWGAISDDQTGRVDVSVATCGARKSGTIVGGVSLSIYLYPIESYSITFGLPPLWSRKRQESSLLKAESGTDNAGMIDKRQNYRVDSVTVEDKLFFSAKSGRASSTTTQDREMFGRNVGLVQTHRETTTGGSTAAIDRTALDGEMGALNFSRTGDDAKPWERAGVKLALKRNGSDIDFEAGKFLTSVSKLAEALTKFREGLSSAVKGEASVGLTLSGELNFFVLDLTATWQRKEQAGPRVPWNVAVSITGKLIDASLTAMYGVALRYTCLSVEVVNAELSVSLTFAGETPIACTRTATVVGGDWQWNDREFPVEAELGVKVVAIGTAMLMGQGVKATAAAKAALKLESKFDPGKASQPPALSGDVTFTGVVLTVTAVDTIQNLRYQSKPLALVDPSTLIQGFKIGTA